eukprot:833878_1
MSSTAVKRERVMVSPPIKKRLSVDSAKGDPAKRRKVETVSLISDDSGDDAAPPPRKKVKGSRLVESEGGGSVEEFSFTPDPSLLQGGTWRDEEILGHNSLAYPIAELIDNSMMATDSVRSRQIAITVVRQSADLYHLVVRDNGRGMDSDGIKELATFALAPKDRKRRKNEVLDTVHTKDWRYLNSQISKFGVGLKNAAFYMGDDMTVVSKQKSSQTVLEFNMNINTMKMRQKNDSDPYKGELKYRFPGRKDQSIMTAGKQLESRTIRKLVESEVNERQFTYIIISNIETRHFPRLSSKESRTNLMRDLASLYHYYLHGPDGLSVKRIREGFRPVDISFQFCDDTVAADPEPKISLRGVKDDIQSQNHLAKRGIPFSFEIHTNSKDPVVGVMFYYPFVNEAETIPQFTRTAHASDLPADQSSSSSSGDQVEGAAGAAAQSKFVRSFEKFGKSAEADPVFNCFWQGRQIPFTNVRSLPFMQATPMFLRKRIRGALFVNETFPVNPQKIIFNEDLHATLSGKDAEVKNIWDHISHEMERIELDRISGSPVRKSQRIVSQEMGKRESPAHRFHIWAMAMSKQYDREILYSESTKASNTITHHLKADYVGKTFQRGDFVQLENTSNLKHPLFGKISYFETRERSDGRLFYVRHPTEIFSEEPAVALTRCLAKDKTDVEVQAAYEQEKEILMRDFPEKMKFVFETKLFDTSLKPVKTAKAGYVFADCFIHVLGHKFGEEEPRLLSKSFFNGIKRRNKMVISQHLETFNEETKEWEEDLTKRFMSNCISKKAEPENYQKYYFKPSKMKTLGRNRMRFRLFFFKSQKEDSQEDFAPILEKSFEVMIHAGDPDHMALPKSTIKLCLGASEAAPVEFSVFDAFENPVVSHLAGKSKRPTVKIDCGQFLVKGNVEFDKDNNTFFLIGLQASPRPDVPSACLPDSQSLEATVAVSFGATTLTAPLRLQIGAGPPTKLVLDESSTFPKFVENRSALPELRVIVHDKFGNPVGNRAVEQVSLEVLNAEDLGIQQNSVVLKRVRQAAGTFLLPPTTFEIPPERFLSPRGKPREVNLRLKITADTHGDQESKRQEVDSVVATVRVEPSGRPHVMYLASDPDGEYSREDQVFNCQVDAGSRFFVKFIDEGGRPANVKLQQIMKTRLRLLGQDQMNPLVCEREKDIIFEIDIPAKMQESADGKIECWMGDEPDKVLRSEFTIDPMHDDPAMWSLEFTQSTQSGAKIGDVLRIFLEDKHHNRIDPLGFEPDDQLVSNPQLKCPSCKITGIGKGKLSINEELKCFVFPEAVIHGPVGSHKIFVALNDTYSIVKSPALSFELEAGDPEALDLELFRGRTPLPGDTPSVHSRDRVTISMRLRDSFGNSVAKGSQKIKVFGEKGLQDKLQFTVTLRDGVGRHDVHLIAEADAKEIRLKITPVGGRNAVQIKPLRKTLKVVPTPGRLVGMKLSHREPVRTVDDRPPEVVCKLTTENGEPFTGTLDGFSLKLTCPVGSPDLSAMYSAPPTRSGSDLCFLADPGTAITSVGSYVWQVRYQEVREEFANLLHKKELKLTSDNFTCKVMYGAPVSLIVKNKERFGPLQATNAGDERQLIDSAEVGVCDQHGNTIPDAALSASKKRMPFLRIGVVDLPDREPSENRPVIVFKYNKKRSFKNIDIKEGSGSVQGAYLLQFSVDSSAKLQPGMLGELKPCNLRFNFSNNMSLLKEQSKYETEYDQINSELQEAFDRIKQITTVMNSFKKLKNEVGAAQRKYPEYTKMSREEALATVDARIADLTHGAASQSVGACLRDNARYRRLKGYIGRMGDLLAAESPELARAIGFLLGSNMNCHIVEDSCNCEAAKVIAADMENNKSVRLMGLDQVLSRSFSDNRANRMPHQREAFPIPGGQEPKYILDYLHDVPLPGGTPLSRKDFESIFVDMLGTTIVMDTRINAQRYRRIVVAKRCQCNRIITLDGYLVQSVLYCIPDLEEMQRKQQSVGIIPYGCDEKLSEERSLKESISTYFNQYDAYQTATAEVNAVKSEKSDLTLKVRDLKRRRAELSAQMREFSGQSQPDLSHSGRSQVMRSQPERSQVVRSQPERSQVMRSQPERSQPISQRSSRFQARRGGSRKTGRSKSCDLSQKYRNRSLNDRQDFKRVEEALEKLAG